jgi:hypothetical protein
LQFILPRVYNGGTPSKTISSKFQKIAQMVDAIHKSTEYPHEEITIKINIITRINSFPIRGNLLKLIKLHEK